MAGKNTPRQRHKPAIDKAKERGRRFTTISIKNFRCFQDFSMGSLEQVNLIGGKNNVGKTTLLEAIFLLLGASNVSLIIKINAFRGVESFGGDTVSLREALWSHLFHNFDNQAPITINGSLVTGKQISIILKQTSGISTTLPSNGSPSQDTFSIGSVGALAQALRLQYTDATGKQYPAELQIDSKGIHIPPSLADPLFPGVFLAARHHTSLQENAARYGQLDMTESHYDLLPALRLVEPRLKRLSTIVVGNNPMLYGDVGLGRMLPLASLGDGLAGLTSLLLAISSASGGVVLIDEIENGLHYSVLVKVWQVIAEAARIYNTQVFATTHSWECIKAAHEAFQTTNQYGFRYHRLQQIDDMIEAVAIDQDTLQTTIESGWEIR